VTTIDGLSVPPSVADSSRSSLAAIEAAILRSDIAPPSPHSPSESMAQDARGRGKAQSWAAIVVVDRGDHRRTIGHDLLDGLASA
jgi:hypothetical protein